jgi:hypothetical protein
VMVASSRMGVRMCIHTTRLTQVVCTGVEQADEQLGLSAAHGCNGSAMQSSVTVFALEIMSDILFSSHFTMRHFSG